MLPSLCLAVLFGAVLVPCAQAQASTSQAATQPASPAQVVQRAGTIKLVEGRVSVMDASGGSVRTAAPGTFVMPSDQLVTEPGSGASLVLRDGTTLVLGPRSRLDLRDFRFDSTTNEGSIWVSLLRGSMRMITGLVSKQRPDALRVQAHTVTIGVRGTDFIVEVDAP